MDEIVLGAARTMTLLKKHQYNIRQDFKLPHNSLFVLGWKTNREWHHCIRPDKRSPSEKSPDELAFYGERISLTLRTVATFLNRRTGHLYGQGARQKTLDEIPSDEQHFESDELEMVHAFSAENQQSLDFDWHVQYGRGFNALNFKVLNSHPSRKGK